MARTKGKAMKAKREHCTIEAARFECKEVKQIRKQIHRMLETAQSLPAGRLLLQLERAAYAYESRMFRPV